MAKRKPVDVAPEPAEDEGGEAQYPRAKYRKNLKNADGYDVRRVESAAEEAKLGKDWKYSPADL